MLVYIKVQFLKREISAFESIVFDVTCESYWKEKHLNEEVF